MAQCRKIKQLGRMAAGWNAAVRELKTSVPAWVKRHSTGEGRITIRQTENTYTLTVTNSVPYGQPLLQRSAEYALAGVERGFPALSVRTPLDNGELALLYALVEATADTERVPGNGTWEMSVSLELHTNAHEQDGEEARYSGSDLVGALCAAGARKDINEAAGDFYLYSLKLAALDRAEVQDDSFIQHAEFRAVVQF